ncbi:hypothetical protein [Actinacidiphila glaucinigra]|uniref:hypothetical protein n=1 Tax=Actinacidiphila glaucinigra TaxID=235986 RepID=UPI0035D79B7C
MAWPYGPGPAASALLNQTGWDAREVVPEGMRRYMIECFGAMETVLIVDGTAF